MRVVFLPAHTITIIILLFALLSACSSPRQIEVSRPRPAQSLPSGQQEVDLRGTVNVVVESGTSELPADVQTLRFRIGEVWLRTSDGKWTIHPVPNKTLELNRGDHLQRTILTTRIPLAEHDSVGVTFQDVYAEFNENAGGPLTVQGKQPVKVGIALSPESGRAATIRLRFEANASLLRLPSHQWHFLPYLTAELNTATGEVTGLGVK